MSSPDASRTFSERRCHAHEPGIHWQRLYPEFINGEVNSFVARYRDNSEPLYRWKPGCALTRTSIPRGLAGDGDHQQHYYAGDCIDRIGAVREREHGTVEHLLVMPITPFRS